MTVFLREIGQAKIVQNPETLEQALLIERAAGGLL
jgi:hypothetical protein